VHASWWFARRHEVCRSLLWNWRRQVRRGTLWADLTPRFPANGGTGQPLLADANHHLSPIIPNINTASTDSKIEITLADGSMVRAGRDLSLLTLRQVMAVLRG
jgi:transposase